MILTVFLHTVPWRSLLLTTGFLVSGCAGVTAEMLTTDVSPVVSEIHVVSHGWHAGIVIRRADIPDDRWPEKNDFPQAEYLEVGWGDHDYYRTRIPGLGTTLKAALWPTVSVLHVVGFRGPVTANFPHSDVITLPITRAGLTRLVAFIDATNDRPGNEPLTSLGPGLYGDSRYYAARGSFHAFNNCNRWTSRALRAAGINVADSITVTDLLAQIDHYRTTDGMHSRRPMP